MKRLRKTLSLILAFTLIFQLCALTASADGGNVVTLGASISEQQKSDMYQYFGTSPENVETITVNNSDERKYMEGIATEAQIGHKTFSCSYIEPTTSGGIQAKTANLTFVTSSMIASTLATSGVENCNVVAAAPIPVSGTGALTGIMMAYETASGEQLNEDQKSAAVEELVTTGEIADAVGTDEATSLMNEVKKQVIEDDLDDPDAIEEVIEEVSGKQGVSLTDEQMEKIASLMETIAQYDYDVKSLKDTLDNLEGKGEGFFAGIWNSIKGLFGGGNNGGIINDTKDELLGSGAVIDSTLGDVKAAAEGAAESAEKSGLWDKIAGFFKGLFGGDSDKDNAEDQTEPQTETQAEPQTQESTDLGQPADNSEPAPAPADAPEDGQSGAGELSQDSGESSIPPAQ